MSEPINWPMPGVVISCQAPEASPLRDPSVMTRMALAALQAGAAGIRAEGAADIAAIVRAVPLPLIGIRKRRYPDSDVYITATRDDVDLVADAGARIVALDATDRRRPGGECLAGLVAHAHDRGLLVMADLASALGADYALRAGVDVLGTTLVPLGGQDVRDGGPNIAAVAAIKNAHPEVVVVAEGRYARPDDVRLAFDAGADTVVVGRAVTDALALAGDFVAAAP